MTVMGQHTVDETKDLITVVNGRIADLMQAVQKVSTDPNAMVADPTVASDFGAFINRWGTAVNQIQTALGVLSSTNPLVPNSVLVAESAFQNVLKAVNQNYPGAYSNQDLPGLQIRLQKLTTIPWTDRQAPMSFDLDLQTYQVADKAAMNIQQGGNALTNTLTTAVSANWKPLLVGGFIAGGVLYGAKRVGVL